jgi:siroheme synthase
MKPRNQLLSQPTPKAAIDSEVQLAVAIAVPQAVGIPLTAQGLADRVTVLISQGDTSIPAPAFDPLETVIAVLPVQVLASLARKLLRDRGFPTNWPVAVVEDALHWTPRSVRAPLHRIAAAAQDAGIRSDVTVIFGPVVRRAEASVFSIDVDEEREVRVA